MRINRADGATTAHDLAAGDPDGAWAQIQADPAAQDLIRGVLLDGAASTVAVQPPQGFKHLTYAADAVQAGDQTVGERLQVQADDVRLTVTFLQSGMVRVHLRRTGHPRHLAQHRRTGP